MIQFKTLSIKNFLSIGKDPIVIEFKEGLNVISGENKDKQDRKNGIGKTSTVSAFYFGIFGKTFVKLNKGDLVNKQTKKDTEVKIVFEKDSVEYTIIRKLKPSSLTLLKDGKDITRDSIDNTDSDIQKIIGVNESVFQNCVLMSVTSHVPFMAQSKVDKRKFIEGIFDLSMFNELLKESRKELNAFKNENSIIVSKIEEKEKNRVSYKEYSDNFEEEKTEELDRIKSTIEDRKKNLKKEDFSDRKNKIKKKDYSKDLKNLKKEDFGDKKKKIDESVNKIKEQKSKLDDKLFSINEKVSKLNTVKNEYVSKVMANEASLKSSVNGDSCPTCLQPLNEHSEELIKEHNNKIKEKVKTYKEKTEKIDDALTKLRESVNKINDVDKKIKEKESLFVNELYEIKDKEREYQSQVSKIKNLQESAEREYQMRLDQIKTLEEGAEREYQTKLDQIKSLEEDLENIKTKKNKFNELLKEVEDELDELRESIKELEKNIYIHENLVFIFSEDGVKSYIIKKMLDLLNSKIDKYLLQLDANCKLTFDEYFEEKIINEKGFECSYFNFSSGERRTIDISVMFAFMEIQKILGKFETNVEFYDELIDSSLDERGVNCVLEILKERSTQKGIYLITHRKEIDSIVSGEIIWLRKENGLTSRTILTKNDK